MSVVICNDSELSMTHVLLCGGRGWRRGGRKGGRGNPGSYPLNSITEVKTLHSNVK